MVGNKGQDWGEHHWDPARGGQGAYSQSAAERVEVVIGRGACNLRDPPPSRPNPSNSDPKIPVIRVRTPENPISRPQENAPAPRGIRTERRDFEKHGYTEGCEG